MKPINRKEVVTGSKWELRVMLTQDTYNNFNTIKTSYQDKHGKTYSNSAFLAKLFSDVSTVARMTP